MDLKRRYASTLFFLFVLCLWNSLQAQLDSILGLPEERHIKALWDYYLYNNAEARISDSVMQLAAYDDLEKECLASPHPEYAKQVWLMRNAYRATVLYQGTPKSISLIEAATLEARKKGWKVIEAECVLYTGAAYFHLGKYGPAFEHMIRGYKMLEGLGFERYPHTMRHIANVGYAYYRFEDYPAAIRYLKKTLDIPPPWNEGGFHRQTLNTIGLCYQRQMMYDSAVYFYTQSHDEAVIAKDAYWAALANGNKGYVLALSGRYEEARPLLEKDYALSIENGEYGSAINAALELAGIVLGEDQLAEAVRYLDFVTQHRNPADLRTGSRYFHQRYELMKKQRRYPEALVMADSFYTLNDRLLKSNTTHINNAIKHKIEVEQYTNRIQALEAARHRQILLRNGILLILLLSAGLVALWINRQRLKQKNETIQRKIADEELRNARQELLSFTETLKAKNELIESFKAEIDFLHKHSSSLPDARAEQIGALLQSTILTEDDWREFRRVFDKVYPGFFGKLKEMLPDLTPADHRLLALTRLKLAPREMMAMLGVTYDAIKKARKRLLSRLNLPDETNLNDFVERIN